MVAKTLKQLRELAKKAGLKGYSKLAKPALEKSLAQTKSSAAKTAPAPARIKSTAVKSTAVKKPRKRTADLATMAAPLRAPTPVDPNHAWWQPATTVADATATVEERIESAKYTPHQSGADAPRDAVTDLGENIDQLPALHRSTLVLLPQKPGVLHAYWALADDTPPAQALKLRLCRAGDHGLDVYQETVVAAARGHHYFHVPETLSNHEVVIQLGYYRAGDFVSAVDRGVARIPSLYAAARTDRRWWISDADFKRMYLRSGGELRGRALGWAGSIGSPSGDAGEQPSGETLAWPGGVSSTGK